MWICTTNAFLSMVDKDCAFDELLVRARVAGHIEAIFPDAKVTQSDSTDYMFRAKVKRSKIAAAMSRIVLDEIKYPNFKDAVRNNRLHDAYAAVWSVMVRLQPMRTGKAKVRAAKPDYASANRRLCGYSDDDSSDLFDDVMPKL